MSYLIKIKWEGQAIIKRKPEILASPCRKENLAEVESIEDSAVEQKLRVSKFIKGYRNVKLISFKVLEKS